MPKTYSYIGKTKLRHCRDFTARLPIGGTQDILESNLHVTRMKLTDNYRAKYRLWAENPRVVPPGAPVKLPHFTSKKFSSHSEMNAWKQSILRQLAHAASGDE